MNNKIKELFQASGMTQKDFAAYIGYTQPYLNNILSDKHKVSEKVYNAIESTYYANVMVAKILYYTECHLVVNPKLSIFYIPMDNLEFELNIYNPKYIGIGKIKYTDLIVTKVYDQDGEIEYDTSLINKLLNDE